MIIDNVNNHVVEDEELPVFLSIIPRNNNTNSSPLTLKVLSENFSVTPLVQITTNDLNKNSSNLRYKQFINGGDSGITVSMDIIINTQDVYGDTTVKKDYKSNDKSVINVLKKWYSNMEVLSIVTEAIDVPNGLYIITNNNKREQAGRYDTIWSIELTSYSPLNLYKWVNDNSAVKNAIKKMKKSTKSSSVKYQALKKCGYKVLVYSKKKKVVKCVKTLQTVLYKKKLLTKKQVDGWYGPVTLKAVKKYQQQYNRKYNVTNNLSSNGSSLIKVSEGTLLSNSTRGQLQYNGLYATTSVNAQLNNNQTTINLSKGKISKRLKVTGKVDKATWQSLYRGE